MKYVKYKKYVPDPSSEMSMEDLLGALSDYLLQSGFQNEYFFDSMQDAEHTLDELRRAIEQALLEGDLLDALVLGPRLPLGTRIRVKAWGAVTLTDRGMMDDKLVCSDAPLSRSERRNVLRFFHFYAKCKGLLNVWRRRPGRNACEGWCDAAQALARARPRHDTWQGPAVDF